MTQSQRQLLHPKAIVQAGLWHGLNERFYLFSFFKVIQLHLLDPPLRDFHQLFRIIVFIGKEGIERQPDIAAFGGDFGFTDSDDFLLHLFLHADPCLLLRFEFAQHNSSFYDAVQSLPLPAYRGWPVRGPAGMSHSARPRISWSHIFL